MAPAGALAGRDRVTIWGRTRTGRSLLVVLWPEQGSLDAYVTGGRELTVEEEAELRRWEATR